MDYEEHKRKALEPIVNYIESVMASYSKEELEARIKIALPEMESEDEKIRKAISAAICGTTATTILEANGTNLSDALSYLEKQKEQKPNVELIQKSWYLEGYHDGKYNNEPKWLIQTGKGGPRYEENQKYGTQKPAEWSEEDKNRFNNLCIVIDESEHWNDVSKQAFKDWLKSLRPQPKQDVFPSLREKEIICLKRALDYLRKEHNRYGGEDFTNEIAVLEWLITHPILVSDTHWKPSEEQISALERAIVKMHTPNDISILAELRDNLKKL